MKSIFTKYIVAFMLIIAFSFTLVATMISTIIFDYFNEITDNQIENTGIAITQLLSEPISENIRSVRSNPNTVLYNYITANRQAVSRSFQAIRRLADDSFSIFVVSRYGEVLCYSGFNQGVALKSGIGVGSDIMETIVKENYVDNSDIGGLLSVSTYVFGMPIKVNNIFIGAVFVCETSSQAHEMSKAAVRAIIMTSLWTMIASLVAVYIISSRISSPLRKMSVAAKEFAVGKFDARIPIRGNDEIATLALAMNNMASSLQQLETARTDFLSSVSHDLRTPMTTISGFIDGMLDDTVPKEKYPYYLRLIGDEVRRLSRLVAALLDISRLQSGDRKFVFAPFDICEMARVILISFENKIEEKNLDVEFNSDDDSIIAYADHDAIYQIFYNICDNAVKFSYDGGKYKINITRNSGKIFVSVYNDGQGISEEDLPRIFDRFYKADKSRGKDRSGTGLGMYIAKSIIDAHGEEIWVNSVFGQDCEFVFTLTPATDVQIKKAKKANDSEET